MEHSQFTSKNVFLLSHSFTLKEVRNFIAQKDEEIVKTKRKTKKAN